MKENKMEQYKIFNTLHSKLIFGDISLRCTLAYKLAMWHESNTPFCKENYWKENLRNYFRDQNYEEVIMALNILADPFYFYKEGLYESIREEVLMKLFKTTEKELKNEDKKQKWFTLREKLPDLNTYVLLYVNRPWNDKDDNPKYVVAKFVANCKNEDKIKYKFEQFGPDTFTMDEVKYWANIDRLDKYFKS